MKEGREKRSDAVGRQPRRVDTRASVREECLRAELTRPVLGADRERGRERWREKRAQAQRGSVHIGLQDLGRSDLRLLAGREGTASGQK